MGSVGARPRLPFSGLGARLPFRPGAGMMSPLVAAGARSNKNKKYFRVCRIPLIKRSHNSRFY